MFQLTEVFWVFGLWVFVKGAQIKHFVIRCVIPLAFIVKRLHLVIENYAKQQERTTKTTFIYIDNVNREEMSLMSYAFVEIAQGNTNDNDKLDIIC